MGFEGWIGGSGGSGVGGWTAGLEVGRVGGGDAFSTHSAVNTNCTWTTPGEIYHSDGEAPPPRPAAQARARGLAERDWEPDGPTNACVAGDAGVQSRPGFASPCEHDLLTTEHPTGWSQVTLVLAHLPVHSCGLPIPWARWSAPPWHPAKQIAATSILSAIILSSSLFKSGDSN